MRKTVLHIAISIVAGIVFAALSSPAFGGLQPPPERQLPPPEEMQFDEEGNPIRPEQDSTKRERKPLESYFFDDSTRTNVMFAWNVSMMRNEINMIDIDTAINSLQMSYPFLRNGVGDAYQGNMGGASIPLSYFDRPGHRDFAFARAFDAYTIKPETARFFNVKLPFTHFSYYSSGNTSNYEEGFYLTHAQNISPSTGFNLDYRSQGTKGFYAWSRAREKNLSIAFSHTGKKYSLHSGYIYNMTDNQENGGVVSDLVITVEREELPINTTFKLTDARNRLKSNTFYLVQSYGFPLSRMAEDEMTIAESSSVFVGHSMTYTRWHKVYTDSREGTIYDMPVPTVEDPEAMENDIPFYRNWYIDNNVTRDSIAESLFQNRAFVQFQPFDREGIVGLIDAGVGIDVHKYYALSPGDYITASRDGVGRTDIYAYGAISGKFRNYIDWGADLRFDPVGDRSGDLEIGARASMSAFIKGRPVTLSGRFRMERRSPVYWMEQMTSNHFVWSRSWNKETETRIDVRLRIPSWALEIGGSQSVVTDKVYYDADALPNQLVGAVSVTGLYAEKVFRLGGLHLENRVLLQWSTEEKVIPVPLASAYLSWYYEFVVARSRTTGKEALRAQIGVDGRYNTKYYAFGYMPATAQFYNQREKELGEYPVLDFFIAAKWKRMRLLLKFEHLNENMFGSRDYFTLLHYPLKKRVFKIGFSWAFYD